MKVPFTRAWLVLAALLAAVTCAVVGAAASPANQAVTVQINPAHSGSIYTPNLYPPFTKAWTATFAANPTYALIAGGKVFVCLPISTVGSTATFKLYGLDAATGSTAWSANFQGLYSFSAIAYDAGKVFAVNFGGQLSAYDANSGTLIWTMALPDQYAFTSAPTAVNGVVYVGGAGDGGTVYAVNETNGEILWTNGVENGDDSSPVVTSDGVYVSYVGPQTYKFDPLSGNQLWQYSGEDEGGGGATPVFYNDLLYVRDWSSSTGHYGDMIDTLTGQLSGYFWNTSVLAPAFDGAFGFATSAGTLYCTDTRSCTQTGPSSHPAQRSSQLQL